MAERLSWLVLVWQEYRLARAERAVVGAEARLYLLQDKFGRKIGYRTVMQDIIGLETDPKYLIPKV